MFFSHHQLYIILFWKLLSPLTHHVSARMRQMPKWARAADCVFAEPVSRRSLTRICLREVVELRKLGVNIQVVSIRPADRPVEALQGAERDEAVPYVLR